MISGLLRVEAGGEGNVWRLFWGDVLLRVRLHNGVLLADYFGPTAETESPDEPFHDPLTFTRAEATILLAPDDRRVRWVAASWEAQADYFKLLLRGEDEPLEAEVRYALDSQSGVLRRQTALRNGGDRAVEVRGANSSGVVLPADVSEIVYLTGRWGGETQTQRETLGQSGLLLESRSGKTGFAFAPYLALVAPGRTYLYALMWSGNWQMNVRRMHNGRVVMGAGLNAWGLRHRLEPGQALALPDVLLACVDGDLNAATQRLHDYRRRVVRPDAGRVIPVQFNSWFPYQGEPPVERMKELAEGAARLGCEVFVLDAGWYTTEVEKPDEGWWPKAGDWIVNKRLFPSGLEELAEYCRALGMEFGIWMEPEAVGASARVHREKPEWLHKVNGRAVRDDERAVLNLGVPEAREYIKGRILAVLQGTGARWFKWDFNTDIYQGGWADGLAEELTRQDPIIAHYEGLYRLADELRAAMPELVLEMCASGGGRFDGAIMSHAHAYWISDATQPLVKLAIHWGSQLAFPPEECNDWLVEWPPHIGQYDALLPEVDERGDLRFRLAVAMLGSFGISAPLQWWGDEDFAVVGRWVDWYKRVVRPVISRGEQFLLTDAPPMDGNGDWAAVWYRQGDGGVLFAFRLAGDDEVRRFALPGLDGGAKYRLSSPDGWSGEQSGSEVKVGVRQRFGAVVMGVERL